MNKGFRALTALLLVSGSLTPLHADGMGDLQALTGGHSTPVPTAAAPAAPAPTPKLSSQAIAAKVAQENAARPLFMLREAQTQDGSTVRVLVLNFGQLDKPYLFSSVLQRGAGEKGLYSGLEDQTFIVSFHREGMKDPAAGDKIELMRRQVEYRADAGTPELKAIEKSIPGEVLAFVPVVAVDAASQIVAVPADPLFLQDLTQAGAGIQAATEGLPVQVAPKMSTLEKMDVYPKNMEVTAQLVFAPAAPVQVKPFTLTMHYSIAALPDNPGFQTRKADARVGYFQQNYKDLSAPGLLDRTDPSIHLIDHWDLRKKDPNAAVSEPVKPIVFWLEDTIPERFRPSITKGILAWNAAFEAIGIKNAIVVKDMDKDLTPDQRKTFDPNDITHNMIRWFVNRDNEFAIGQSRVNPLTGQIYSATVSISDSLLRDVHDMQLAPPAAPQQKGSDKLGDSAAEDARLALEAHRQAAEGIALLEGHSGPLSAADQQRYIDQYMTYVAMHEVGHTLGLRHNFKGSQLLALDRAGQNGIITSSVMDYVPPNIAPKGAKQGDYYQSKVGPYDRWAIEYGYKPVDGKPSAQADALKAIAARADRDRTLTYGPDEDRMTGDPDAQVFDLGRGELPFATSRVTMAKDLWTRLAAEAKDPNADGSDIRLRF
ncbi:MAG: zinc-dependent metalloprotease, partial [Elusimicrobia bacterium]|nr:zinc-dependent metalloprotease [Elusimicrobiota bacterium]